MSGITCVKCPQAQYVKDHKMQTSTFKQKVWEEIDEQLEKVVGVRYGVDRLKSKFNRLRKQHREFSELIDHTGTTYNAETNIVHAAEEVWQMFYVKNKSFKQYRKKGLEQYGLLGEIFNNTTATGKLHHASTQKPPTSDEERAMEEDFISKGVHVDLSNVGDTGGDTDIDYQVRGDTNEGSRRKAVTAPSDGLSKKESKKAKMDSVMDALSLALSSKHEVNQARFDRYKVQTPTSEVSDPYSIEECMDLLESIEGVETTSYNKALEKFTSVEWRKMFMKMSAGRRMKWLESLE